MVPADGVVEDRALAALLTAEAAALRAAEVASSTYERVAGDDAYLRLDPAAIGPLRGGVPDAPLLCAIDDLGSAAYAAARTIHFAMVGGDRRPPNGAR